MEYDGEKLAMILQGLLVAEEVTQNPDGSYNHTFRWPSRMTWTGWPSLWEMPHWKRMQVRQAHRRARLSTQVRRLLAK